jgi:hypothetical protein
MRLSSSEYSITRALAEPDSPAWRPEPDDHRRSTWLHHNFTWPTGYSERPLRISAIVRPPGLRTMGWRTPPEAAWLWFSWGSIPSDT